MCLVTSFNESVNQLRKVYSNRLCQPIKSQSINCKRSRLEALPNTNNLRRANVTYHSGTLGESTNVSKVPPFSLLRVFTHQCTSLRPLNLSLNNGPWSECDWGQNWPWFRTHALKWVNTNRCASYLHNLWGLTGWIDVNLPAWSVQSSTSQTPQVRKQDLPHEWTPLNHGGC